MTRHRADYFAPAGILSFVVLLVLLIPIVNGQAQTRLVPLVTDQTPLALSNEFGIPFQGLVNQAGDYVFVGRVGTGFFYRSAGGPIVRLFQMADEVPGFPGSRADIMTQIRLNNSGEAAFRVDFFQANGVGQGIIFFYHGSTLQRLVAGDDIAPGTGGAKFERALSLIGINDAGDIAFTAPLVSSASGLPVQTTLYIKPSGGAPVRVAGLGDAAPGTGGTLTSLTPISLNALGEVLFRSNITGGAGGQGLFVGDISGVRKVVATGDPNPAGGTFAGGPAFLNNASEVGFQVPGALFLNTIASGNTQIAASGDAVPAPVGGTLGGGFGLQTFSDGGDLVFICNVVGTGGVTNNGLFRRRSGSPVEIVAYRNQPVPGTPGEIFNSPITTNSPFTGISVNATGTVSFRSALTGGSPANGVFQQSGANAPINIALDGEAANLTGGGTYSFANTIVTRTLDDSSVYFTSDIAGGAAEYGEFLTSGGTPMSLMNTKDLLPAGARVVLRTFRLGAAGDYVGFLTQRTGGHSSIAVHNIASHATSIVVTDGDAAPGTGGGRLMILTPNTIFLNSSGTVAFPAQVQGGAANANSGIFTAAPGSSVAKVVLAGEVDAATGRTHTALQLNLVTPTSINDAGQVVFSSLLVPATGPSIRGVFVGSAGSAPSKIAAMGDVMSDGRTISQFINSNTVWLNSTGQVAFVANTTGGGSGIYVGTTGGGTPVKVVATGDAGPGGSTFSGFATPGFNDSGEVAFTAALSGGPGGGVFVGSTSLSPVSVALNGDPAPGGGIFSITQARPDALINSNHDLALRANLTSGTADSGYFIRRGASGLLNVVVSQGQSAPGTTGGSYATIMPGVNGLISENFQLGPDGDLAFQNLLVAPGGGSFGTWHVKTDNTLEEILVRASIASEFGGGSAVISTGGTAWNSGGRYPMWARISGGTFTDGIFLFVPVTEINTPAGTIVPVTVTDSTTGTAPVSMTFDSVTQAGETTLTTSSGGPAIPNAFSLGDPPLFYNVQTTATFSGAINICIDFSSVSFPPGSNLRLLHFDGTSWVDVTTSGPSGNVICGSVTSLSPFTVAQVLDHTPPALAVTLTPNTLWPANKKLALINATIQVSDDFDPSPSVRLISITCNEPLTSGDITGAAFNTDDRSFSLRADRAGKGTGRIYTVTYRATDAFGNSTTRTVTVVVPHDQGH